MKRFLIAAMCLPLLSGASLAHNSLFFPGDAYFSAKFGTKFFDDFKGGADPVIRYERFAGQTFNCGYVGYENLKLVGLSEKIQANLRTVHGLVYAEFITGEAEKILSPAALFVYNRSFPLGSPFGVKYNEHWVEIQEGEAQVDNAIYDSIGDAMFVIDDWASAKAIPPLAIADDRAPLVNDEGNGRAVEEPLKIDAAKVKFVVLAGNDVAKFARREEGLVFFVVTEEIKRYRFDRKGVAMPQPVRARADKMAAYREKIAEDQQSLRAAMMVYELNFGVTPLKSQGIEALVAKPKANAPGDWMPVLKEIPKDPWGNDYRWDGDVVFSLGADGVESSDDIVEPFGLTEDGEVIPPPLRGG